MCKNHRNDITKHTLQFFVSIEKNTGNMAAILDFCHIEICKHIFDTKIEVSAIENL